MSLADPQLFAFWTWGIFAGLVLAMLAVDLGLGGRRRVPTLREAGRWSVAWILLGTLFGLVVLALFDSAAAVTYFTASLLEKSLSLDNLFVFALVFGQLAIPAEHQRRVLSWGIVGPSPCAGFSSRRASRCSSDSTGSSTRSRRCCCSPRLVWGEKQERAAVVAARAACGSWVARVVPVTLVMRGGRFWIRHGGRLAATLLFIALVVVETSDAVFALDSIPAVLAGALGRFHALRYAMAGILAFVAAKMLLGRLVDVPSWVSLLVIVLAVATTVLAPVRRTAGPELADTHSGAPVPCADIGRERTTRDRRRETLN